MAEDTAGAASATDSAGSDAQQQGQGAAGAAKGDGTQGGSGAPGAASSASGAGDLDAAGMLADAVNSPEGDGDGGDGAEPGDPAARLAKIEADYKKLQRQSRNWEDRAKANAEKAKAHDAYVESQKTEAQKQADALAAAREEARTERTARLRLLAAASYDLPVSMIDHLAGGTEDEINASAEQLAAAINERAAILAAAQAKADGQQNGQQQGPRNGGSSRPVESLRAGALPASGGSPATPNDWIRAAAGNKR